MAQKKTITSDDILGKDAVDPEGEILGVVMKMHIDKESKKIIGLTVDEGFMKPDLFIGIEYIKNFGVDSVFLNRVPAAKFTGLEIVDQSGSIVGIVKEVRSKRHKVSEIIISKKGAGISRQKLSIASKYIQEIGDVVVLKKGYRVRDV